MINGTTVHIFTSHRLAHLHYFAEMNMMLALRNEMPHACLIPNMRISARFANIPCAIYINLARARFFALLADYDAMRERAIGESFARLMPI